MFGGLEVLVLGAIGFVFVTTRNDSRALRERLETAEKELRALRGYVQAQKASRRDRAAVLQLLESLTAPVRIRLSNGVERTGLVRGVEEGDLLLEGLPTPYDEEQDPALRTERVAVADVVAYLDEAGFWQRMPRG